MLPIRLIRFELIVTRPRNVAADPRETAVLDTNATLRRAYPIRDGAQLQVDQFHALVQRLERDRRELST
jgi:hypothetical protein